MKTNKKVVKKTRSVKTIVQNIDTWDLINELESRGYPADQLWSRYNWMTYRKV
jgi:hypothetical protein